MQSFVVAAAVAFGCSRCPQRTLLHDADGPIVEWPKQ
jgi:hypothetical protein